MKVCNLKPNQHLRQYVNRYWLWEDEPELPQMLPGTGTELVIHYSEPFMCINSSGKIVKVPKCHIISPRFASYHFQTIKTGFISVRFRAGAFRHFCKYSHIDLIDSFIDINDIWGKAGNDFGSKVLEAPTIKQRIVIIEQFLMNLLEIYQKSNIWLDTAVKEIFYNSGSNSLKKVSHDVFISDRQLQRKFKEAVGVSPKTFQRISRFENVLKYLLLNKKQDYLAIALENGYYDQSHFLKEFETFVGEYPSSFLQYNNFMSHFYNERLLD